MPHILGLLILVLLFYNFSLQGSLQEAEEALEIAEEAPVVLPPLPPAPKPTVEKCVALYVDSDGDGFGNQATEEELCEDEELPFGRATRGGDCNDFNSSVWRAAVVYTDRDSDGFSTNMTGEICTNNQIPLGSLVEGTELLDCNDKSDIIFPGSTWPETADSPDYDCDGNRDLPVGSIFVTSKKYKGDFGGLSGADGKCQGAALSSEIPLTGTWQAFLSTSTVNAIDRLPDTSYMTSLRGTIADNKTELFRGFIESRIRYTEDGDQTSNLVWTGTDIDGRFSSELDADMSTCGDWTSSIARAIIGASTMSTNWNWLNTDDSSCGSTRALYCVRVS